MKKSERVYCFNCKHFYITWDGAFPYGCKGFDMKSKQLPCNDVIASSGKHCLLFERKRKKRW